MPEPTPAPLLTETPRGQAPPAVSVHGVVYRYRGTRRRPGASIGPVTLSVGRGEHVALAGENASGKSTLLHMLCGATTPMRGEARWFGGAIDPSRIGVVFQSPALDDLLTVREALSLAASVAGLSGAAGRARGDELAERLGFADRLDDRCGALSGGLRRRADLARALLHSPDLLLLDEATAGLDEASRQAFRGVLAEERAAGVAVVAATHDLEEVRDAGRVVLLRGGRVALDIAGDELRTRALAPALRIRGAPEDARRLLAARGIEVRSGVATVPIEDVPESELGPLLRKLADLGCDVRLGMPTMQDLADLAGRASVEG